jgi:hypothetical protein
MPAGTVSTIGRSRYSKGLATRAASADATCKRKAAIFELMANAKGEKKGTRFSLFLRLDDFRISAEGLSSAWCCPANFSASWARECLKIGVDSVYGCVARWESTCFASSTAPSNHSIPSVKFSVFSTISGNLLLARGNPRGHKKPRVLEQMDSRTPAVNPYPCNFWPT